MNAQIDMQAFEDELTKEVNVTFFRSRAEDEAERKADALRDEAAQYERAIANTTRRLRDREDELATERRGEIERHKAELLRLEREKAVAHDLAARAITASERMLAGARAHLTALEG